jgi:hypothetical protein
MMMTVIVMMLHDVVKQSQPLLLAGVGRAVGVVIETGVTKVVVPVHFYVAQTVIMMMTTLLLLLILIY